MPAETDKERKESETQTDENGNIPSEKDPESFASPPVDSEVISRKIEIPNNKVFHVYYVFIIVIFLLAIRSVPTKVIYFIIFNVAWLVYANASCVLCQYS